jgi:signal transduction histidine kinase/ActR/RegA family two-component response regulator
MFAGETERDRILLVDDEPGILVTTQAILEADGYEVETANSGKNALKMLEGTNYDLLVLDLRMDDMDGLELLEQTRQFFPQPLAIVLTGYASLESAIKALHLGAYDYLIKPCNVFDLKYSVKRALEHRRLSDAEALLHVSQSINSSLDRNEILSAVAQAAKHVLGLERGVVALFDPAVACSLQVQQAVAGSTLPERLFNHGLLEDSREVKLKTISTAAEQGGSIEEMINNLFHGHPGVIEQLFLGYSFTSNNTSEDVRLISAWVESTGVKSFLAAPIRSKERLFGMLYVDSLIKSQNFNYAAMRLIQGLADQAAVALENARLFDELVSKNQEFIKLNEELKKLDHLKSNFLNIATHELRTPISIVLGYNIMLKEELDGKLTSDQEEVIDESITHCRRLVQLVNSMLDISRIESGKLEMNIDSNDIRWCIDSAARLLRERLRSKQIELKIDIDPSMPLIPFDVDRLQQVFINLIDNAIKFTAARGRITIRASLKKNELPEGAVTSNSGPDESVISSDQILEVSVEDTGVGICEQEQKMIFDEFAQSSNQPEDTERLPSSGLGLAIAKKIVTAHNGRIWVESRINHGSKFIFHLPADEARPSHNYQSRHAAQGILS